MVLFKLPVIKCPFDDKLIVFENLEEIKRVLFKSGLRLGSLYDFALAIFFSSHLKCFVLTVFNCFVHVNELNYFFTRQITRILIYFINWGIVADLVDVQFHMAYFYVVIRIRWQN